MTLCGVCESSLGLNNSCTNCLKFLKAEIEINEDYYGGMTSVAVGIKCGLFGTSLFVAGAFAIAYYPVTACTLLIGGTAVCWLYLTGNGGGE